MDKNTEMYSTANESLMESAQSSNCVAWAQGCVPDTSPLHSLFLHLNSLLIPSPCFIWMDTEISVQEQSPLELDLNEITEKILFLDKWRGIFR